MEKLAYLTFSPSLEADADGLPKRFSGVAYSGGVIPQYGPYGNAAIDLATLRVPETALFALVDHDPSQRAGKLTATVQGGAVHIAGEFFTASVAGREVAALFSEGAPWQLSVGIQATALAQSAPVAVNGQTLAVNTLFSNAVLREVSFVPVGADPSTAVVAFSLPTKDLSMPDEALDELDQIKAQLAEMTTRALAAETALGEIKAAARRDAIAALSAEIHKEFSAEQQASLANLPEEVFAFTAGILRAHKPAAQAPEHLFSEQATQGAETTKPRLAELNAKLIHQVAGH